MGFIGGADGGLTTILLTLILVLSTILAYKAITMWYLKTTPNLETLNKVLSKLPKKKHK